MMHIDFTLVISETQEIILAIELDDNSHSTNKAKENDEKKNAALAESRVYYARVPLDKMYDQNIMKKIVDFCTKRLNTK